MAVTLITITPATEDTPRWLVLGEDNRLAWYVELDTIATAPTSVTCLLKRGSSTIQTVTVGGSGGTVTATFTAAALTAGNVSPWEVLQISLEFTLNSNVERYVEEVYVTDLRLRPSLTATDLSAICDSFGGSSPCYPSGQTNYKAQTVLGWKMVMSRAIAQGLDRHPATLKTPDVFREVHLWQTAALLAQTFISKNGVDSRWAVLADLWERNLDRAWTQLEGRYRARTSTQFPEQEADTQLLRGPAPLRLTGRDPYGLGRF